MASESRPRRPAFAGRLTVRSAMLLTALVALGLWSARRIWENATPRAALVTRQLSSLRHGNPASRLEAALLLGQAEAPLVPRVLPPLLLAMREPDPALLVAAAQSLASLAHEGVTSSQALAAAPLLIEALGDDQPEVRCSSALALAIFARTAGPTEPAHPTFNAGVQPLLELLDDPEPMGRAAAIDALQSVSEWRAGAPRALLDATRDPNVYVRRVAIEALARPWSNREEVQRVLMSLLRASRSPVEIPNLTDNSASHAQRVLSLAEPLTEESIAGLIEIVAEGPDSLRNRAATMLGKAGGRAESALPILATLLTEPRSGRFEAALVAIRQIDPNSLEARQGAEASLDAYLEAFQQNRSNGMNADWERELLNPTIPLAWLYPRLRDARSSDDPIRREAAQNLLERLMPQDQTSPR